MSTAFTPDDVAVMLDDPEYHKLPFAKRQETLEKGLTDAGSWLQSQPDYDRATHRDFTTFANGARSQVTASESAGETARRYAGVAGNVLKDSALTIGTQLLDVAPINPDLSLKPPLQNVARSLTQNVGFMAESARAMMTPAPALEEQMGRLKKGLDDGEFMDASSPSAWLKEQDQQLAQRRAGYFQQTDGGTDPALYQQHATGTGLTHAENQRLVADYLRTRSPQAWDALRKNLLKTPQRKTLEATAEKANAASPLAQGMEGVVPGSSRYLAEAGDPFELLGNVIPIFKGAKLAKKGLTAGRRLAEGAQGVGAEMLSEQASLAMSDPNATNAERLQVLKDSAVGAGVLTGGGAVAGAVLDRRAVAAQPTEGLEPEARGLSSEPPASSPQPPTPTTLAQIAQNAGQEGATDADFAAQETAFTTEGTEERRGSEPSVSSVPSVVNLDNSASVTPAPVEPASDPKTDVGSTPAAGTSSGLALGARGLSPQPPASSPQPQASSGVKRMPVIPDSPLGDRDVLDYLNENPLSVPRKGTTGMTGEYDWREQIDIPNYYRKFLVNNETGRGIDVLAQEAYENGLIREPTPDALAAEIDASIRKRTTYRVQMRQQAQQERSEIKRHGEFDQAQQGADTTVLLRHMEKGDTFDLDTEQNVKVTEVTRDENGAVDTVTIEDGRRFGVLTFDAKTRMGILVDEWKPKAKASSKPEAEGLSSDPQASSSKHPASSSGNVFSDATGLLVIADTIRIMAREAKTLTAFAKRMSAKFGAWIRPHVQALWNALKDATGKALMKYLEKIGAVKFAVPYAEDNGPVSGDARQAGNDRRLRSDALGRPVGASLSIMSEPEWENRVEELKDNYNHSYLSQMLGMKLNEGFARGSIFHQLAEKSGLLDETLTESNREAVAEALARATRPDLVVPAREFMSREEFAVLVKGQLSATEVQDLQEAAPEAFGPDGVNLPVLWAILKEEDHLDGIRASGVHVVRTKRFGPSLSSSQGKFPSLSNSEGRSQEVIGEASSTPEMNADATGLLVIADTIRIIAREAKTLTAFAKRMSAKFGAWIRPHVQALWNALKDATGKALMKYLEKIGAVKFAMAPDGFSHEVYEHWTEGDFTEFDLKQAGKTDEGFLGRGIYFTPGSGSAASPYGSKVIHARLRLKSPLKLDVAKYGVSSRDLYGVARAIASELGGLRSQAVKLMALLAETSPVMDAQTHRLLSKTLTAAIKSAGHDGVTLVDSASGSEETVVFSPSQIKRVDSTSQPSSLQPPAPSPSSSVSAQHAEALRTGDTATAQALVDAQAQAHGYTPAFLYHGTNRSFDTIKPDRETGLYFVTPDAGLAKRFGANVLKVYTSARDVFDATKVKDLAALSRALEEANVHPDSIKAMTDAMTRPDNAETWLAFENMAVIKALKSLGYQGFHAREHGKPTMGLFDDPALIKSAELDTGVPLEQRFDADESSLRYSRTTPETESPASRTRNEIKNAAVKSAATKLNKTMPGWGDTIVVRNVGTLRNVKGFQDMGLTRADLQDLKDGKLEGFYSPKLGVTVILSDYLKVDELGPELAAMRLISHENAHKGADIMRRDRRLRAEWDNLAKGIRREHGAEMDRIAREEGYGKIAGNDSALADEWAARKLGSMTKEEIAALKPYSLLRRVFNHFRDLLRRAYGSVKSSAIMDSDVLDWLARARDSVLLSRRNAKADINPVVARFFARALAEAETFAALTRTERAAIEQTRKDGYTFDADTQERSLNGRVLAWSDHMRQSAHHFTRVAELKPGQDAELYLLEWKLEDIIKEAGGEDGRTGIMASRVFGLHIPGTAQAGEVSTVFYERNGPFRVQSPNLRAILTGGLLPAQLAAELTTSNHAKAALNESAARITQDLNTTITDYARRTGQPLQQVYDTVNGALESPARLALVLDPSLHEATRRVRNFLDDLSTATATITGGQSGAAILANLGQWMRRSYAAFDPASGWSYDALERAAAAGNNIAGQPARAILANARAFLRTQNPTYTPQQIEAIMRQLTDRETWGAVLTGDASKVTKDVGSLMRRQDIPAPLRALMGEETNPIKRVLSSASFQAQFIARHEMQVNMSNVGLALGIFSTTQEGVYSAQIGGDAGPGNRRWSGFGELYTTPEMLGALTNARGVMTGTDLGGKALTAFKLYGSEAKLASVALNAKSWVPNALGNVWGLVANGDAFSPRGWRSMAEAWRLMRSGQARTGAAMGTAAGVLQDQRRQMLTRLRAAGVASGGLEMEDLEANLDNSVLQFIDQNQTANVLAGAGRGAIVGQSLGAALGGMPGRGIGAALGAVTGGAVGSKRIVAAQKFIAKWVMSHPDNFGKISAFLTNYETALAAGQPHAAAFAQASERTLNTMPDYSKLHPLARELSRLGMVGSFIGFQHEVYRNVFWNVRYAITDLRSGNPTMMAAGARRLAGVALAMSMNKMMLGALLSLAGMGFDPEDEEKARAYRETLARPWDRFSDLHFKQLDSTRATYMNTSYLIPQSTMLEIVRAATEGRTWEESIGNIAAQFADQFVEGSVHADPLLEAVMNRRKFGPELTPNSGWRGFVERLDHVLQPVTPGTVKTVNNVIRAEMGRSRGDVEYATQNEVLGLLGLRLQTRTHDLGMKDHLYGFANRMKTARQIAEQEWSNYGKGKTDTIGRMEQENAVARANAEIAEIAADFAAWKTSLGKLGISESRVKGVMKDRKIYVNPKPLKLGKAGPETVK